MSARAHRPDASLRRARFAVPLPSGSAGADERLRLVDPTGSAVAWLGYGETVLVLGFFVREDDGSWREVLRDRVVETGSPVAVWMLLERDPTMARLRGEADGQPREIVASISDGILTIVDDSVLLLVIGGDPGHP